MLIGMVGLGSMGAPMARNLATQGDNVLAFDIDRSLVDAVVGDTIHPAGAVDEIAERCDLVVTMVWDDAALRDVCLGTHGILAASGFAGCAVDLSTTSLDIALELAAALAQRGATFLDGAVIGGGAPAAKAAASPIVIAGNESAFHRFLPVLSRLGTCDYVGAQGNAKVTKIINNLLVGVNTAANAEALSLGVAAGIELADLVMWLADGEGGSAVLSSYMGRYVKEGRYGNGLIGHALMTKDVSLACSLADQMCLPMPLAEAARQTYVACAQALGREAQFPSVFNYFNDKVIARTRKAA